jgi:negative regulator of flagellin synthesis FlgM
MKIGSVHDTPAAAEVAVRGNARAGTAAPATPAASTEKVEVSSAGAQMVAMSGSSDFDSAKVDAIRQAIRDGKFTVNPGAIADRLISDAKSLLSPRAAKP